MLSILTIPLIKQVNGIFVGNYNFIILYTYENYRYAVPVS